MQSVPVVMTVTSSQPWQSKVWVKVATKGTSYTVIVSVGPGGVKGTQGVVVVRCNSRLDLELGHCVCNGEIREEKNTLW